MQTARSAIAFPHGHETRNSARAVGRAVRQGSAGSQETSGANGFHFDTVQMPINVLDAHYRSFEKEIVPLAQQEGTAVLGMKPLGSGLILESGAASAQDCLRYAMSVSGVSVTITGCDSEAASSARAHPPGDEVGE